MAVYKRDIVDINLETGNIHRSFLKHSIGYMDQKADHFGIRAYRDGVPVDLTGVSVQGVFMPPQGSPIAITSGNIVDFNEAEVVLPQACYNYDGQFTLAIKLVDSTNSVTGTMRIVDGMVDNTHASGTVAPTEAVPTYQEIIAVYEDLVDALADVADYAENFAPAFAAGTANAAGSYVMYEGDMYLLPDGHTANTTWANTTKTQVTTGGEMVKLAQADSDLKSALGEESPNLVVLPDAVIDKTSAYNVKITTSTDGKVVVEGKKSTSGTAVLIISSVFYIPAGDYYFGSRKGVLGGIYFQIRESSSPTTPTDAGSIAALTGFKKITISTGAYAFVRIALHNTDTYVGGTELYPELVSVNNANVFAPGGTIANDPIARITNTNEEYGFLSTFTQKRISVIGDSISSYNNQIYCGNYVYYYPNPSVPDVDCAEKTWWMRVANASGSLIVFNESEAGAYASNQRGQIIPGDDRPDFYDRVQTLYARNVNPDLIFVALGTNDSVGGVDVGEYDFDTPYTDLSEATFRPAYTKGIKALQDKFPNAKIVCLIFQMDDAYAQSIANIAFRLGCEVINCNPYDTGSSVHPNEMGMRQIASAILYNAERNGISVNWSAGAVELNDYKTPGVYILASGLTYSHLPSDIPNPSQAMQLAVLGHPSIPTYRIQRLYFTSGNTVAHYNEYIRVMSGSTWNDWVKVYDLDAEKAFKKTAFIFIPNGTKTDLNEFDTPGFSILDSTVVYDHLPDGITTGAKHLIVYGNQDADYRIQRLYVTGGNTVSQYREFIRIRNSATNWNPWREVYNKADFDTLMEKIAQADNTVSEYTDDTFTGTTGYTGTKLRFLSYNVANYNKDTSVYISDEKRTNFKKMLSEVQADFIGLQEENSINGVSEGSPGYESSHDYIYAPVYPVEYGTTTCSLKSKISATTNYSVMRYPAYKPDGQDDPTVGYRWLRAAIFTVNNKRVLVCSTHPVANQTVNGVKTGGDSAHSIAARAEQYEAMFKWVTRYVDPQTSEQYALERVTPSGQFVTCGEWDYCVICGDMNSSTTTDKTNLKTLAETYGFSMANGGWLGWLETCRNAAGTLLYSLDNVIVSSGCVITGVRACKSLYSDLYSDHYPFVADVVLKDN